MWCAKDRSLPGFRCAASATLTSPGDMPGRNLCSTFRLLVIFPSRGSYQHGHPASFPAGPHPLPSRFQRCAPLLGWVPVPAVPHRHSSYAALRLPDVLRPRLRFPSPSAYLRVGWLFLTASSVHPSETLGRPRLLFRLSWTASLEETSGPPRLLGRPLDACRIRTPRPGPPRLALVAPRRFRLQLTQQPGHPRMAFSRLNAPAHTFACLRIARAVVAAGARLATDLPGSALVGSVSHRLDDESEFQGSIVPPFLPDQPCLVAPRLCGSLHSRGPLRPLIGST